MQKSCKKVCYVYLLKFAHFTQKSRNLICSVTLEIVLLVGAINKSFQKYFYNVKTY